MIIFYCYGNICNFIQVWGDSAGAHFHIPPQWMNVSEMNQSVFDQLYYVLLDELSAYY